jgi:hypothetical protein
MMNVVTQCPVRADSAHSGIGRTTSPIQLAPPAVECFL